MTRPETCGMAGGAISLWFRMISCTIETGITTGDSGTSGNVGRGIITTIRNSASTGFHVYCIDDSRTW